MSKQIKVNYSEVEHTLTKLKSSCNLLSAPYKELEGSNNLNAFTKLNLLNEKLHQLSNAYKDLLIDNVEATQKSVSALKEADKMLSSSIMPK